MFRAILAVLLVSPSVQNEYVVHYLTGGWCDSPLDDEMATGLANVYECWSACAVAHGSAVKAVDFWPTETPTECYCQDSCPTVFTDCDGVTPLKESHVAISTSIDQPSMPVSPPALDGLDPTGNWVFTAAGPAGGTAAWSEGAEGNGYFVQFSFEDSNDCDTSAGNSNQQSGTATWTFVRQRQA